MLKNSHRIYLVVLIFTIITAISLAQSVIAQRSEGAELLGEEALIVDAQRYASEYSLDLEEALHRLQLQDDIDGLESALIERERNTFGGLWIQHRPEFRIVVAFTQTGQETISPYIENKSWLDFVEVRTAKVTLADLEAVQDDLHHILEKLNVPANSLVDVVENRVELRVTERTHFDAALQKADLLLPDHVVVVVVDKLMTPTSDIFGGKALSWCTSGFSVQHPDGTKGITTAAHCPDDNISYNGVILPHRGGIYGGPYDVQWHRANHAFVVRNLVFDGTWNRYIYATKHRDNQSVGEFVCEYGKTTGSSCGNIVTKHLRPVGGDAPPDATATYIEIANTTCGGGDSGGPVFSGNTAYGTVVANGTNCIYMAVNYVSNLGVTVLTQ